MGYNVVCCDFFGFVFIFFVGFYCGWSEEFDKIYIWYKCLWWKFKIGFKLSVFDGFESVF